MFLAAIFIIIGLFILLNAFGIISGNFWGFIWGIIFLVIGLRLLAKKGKCPICGWHHWEGKMHKKMHEHCGCGHNHEEGSQENQ